MTDEKKVLLTNDGRGNLKMTEIPNDLASKGRSATIMTPIPTLTFEEPGSGTPAMTQVPNAAPEPNPTPVAPAAGEGTQSSPGQGTEQGESK